VGGALFMAQGIDGIGVSPLGTRLLAFVQEGQLDADGILLPPNPLLAVHTGVLHYGPKIPSKFHYYDLHLDQANRVVREVSLLKIVSKIQTYSLI